MMANKAVEWRRNMLIFVSRTLFWVSALMIGCLLSMALASFAGLDLSEWLYEYFFHGTSLGSVGFFWSVIFAAFVRCSHCGEKALVIPDPDPDSLERDHYHQPWRRTCGHCAKDLFRR